MNIDLNKRSEYIGFGKLNGGEAFLCGSLTTVYVKFKETLLADTPNYKRNAINLNCGTPTFIGENDLVIPLAGKFTYH